MRDLPEEDPSLQLDRGESFWRDHEPWLKAAGYVLRPRYHSEWIPSWLVEPEKFDMLCEDYRPLMLAPLMDAVREFDGLRVMLKWTDAEYNPTEVYVANFFSSEPLPSNPRNHSIPVYEILKVPDENNRAILVMPFFLRFDRPPFVCLGEIVDFIQQILEGLQFMHRQNVAHCDVKGTNIMSDALPLYDVPPHPLMVAESYTLETGSRVANSRTQRSTKHYLVDLGLSHLYLPGIPRLLVPRYGGNYTVPEFQDDSIELCDPFAVDIYCTGDLLRKRFRKGGRSSPAFHGLEFMDSLIADMTQDDPEKRPTIDEVVERFSRIARGLSRWKLLSRASTVDEAACKKILKNAKYWMYLPITNK